MITPKAVAATSVTLLVAIQCSAQPCFRWIERNPSHRPAQVSSRSMAFDSSHGVSVLYNGTDLMGGRGTWEWDGEQWFLRTATGPDAGFRHTMVFDTMRSVTISFGGSIAGEPTDELWEWDGDSWSRPSIPQPRPGDRHNHAAAYDSQRGVMVVFGGIGELGNLFGGTPEFDGERWIFPLGTGPVPRHSHAMAYDAHRGVTVLFGALIPKPLLVIHGNGTVTHGRKSPSAWVRRQVAVTRLSLIPTATSVYSVESVSQARAMKPMNGMV